MIAAFTDLPAARRMAFLHDLGEVGGAMMCYSGAAVWVFVPRPPCDSSRHGTVAGYARIVALAASYDLTPHSTPYFFPDCDNVGLQTPTLTHDGPAPCGPGRAGYVYIAGFAPRTRG